MRLLMILINGITIIARLIFRVYILRCKRVYCQNWRVWSICEINCKIGTARNHIWTRLADPGGIRKIDPEKPDPVPKTQKIIPDPSIISFISKNKIRDSTKTSGSIFVTVLVLGWILKIGPQYRFTNSLYDRGSLKSL